jgi:hypothetical protein
MLTYPPQMECIFPSNCLRYNASLGMLRAVMPVGQFPVSFHSELNIEFCLFELYFRSLIRAVIRSSDIFLSNGNLTLSLKGEPI